jgi:hypothetical protein
VDDLARLIDEYLTLEEAVATVGDITEVCYRQQREFVCHPGKRNLLRKTRRAGGTVGVAVKFLRKAKQRPYANQLYVTSTLKNARRLVWPTLKRLNDKYKLGGVPNETEAFLRFPQLPGEPHIYLGGAKDQEEIDKIRGIEGGLKYVAIDEAQSMRQKILQPLIDDVVEPSLLDYDGTLDVVGTPGPVKAGYFYDADEGVAKDAWNHFKLSLLMNPFLEQKSGKPTAQLLAELLKSRNWTENHPTYRREYLGEWVTDLDAVALHYDAARNACEWQDAPVTGWKYILVFDIGFEDADAIAVLGWAPGDRRLRLVKEVITRKQGITELGNQLKLLYTVFHPLRCVGDMGALGKKIGKELQDRWALPIEAAEKERKAEHIAFLDDALITSAFLAPPDSAFAQDCLLVQWDQDAKARNVLRFDESYHSDIIDAVLYGYRAAWHWLEKESPPPTVPGSAEAHRAEVRAMLAEARAMQPQDEE